MPFTDDKTKKLNELFEQAFEEVRKKEFSFDEDLVDANFSKQSLNTEIKAKYTEIWKTVEVKLNDFNSQEKELNELKAELKKLKPVRNMSFEEWWGDEKNQKLITVELHDKITEKLSSIEHAESNLTSLNSDINSQLIQELKEHIRLTINSKIQPNYETTLKIFEAPGLAEIIDPNKTIDTGAKNSLLYMLNTMSGGSIGIAGSRGAGKSTLIHMCCGQNRLQVDIGGEEILPVFTSAPVQYESRDFILYLFSTVCQRVLNPRSTQNVLFHPPDTDGYSQPPLQAGIINTIMNEAPRTLNTLGAGLIILSIIAAIFISLTTMTSPQSQSVGQSSNQSNSQTPSPSSSPITNSSPSEQNSATSIYASTIKNLEIKPGALLTWGVFLIFSGVSLILLKRGFVNISFFPQSYKEYAAASDTQRKEWTDTVERMQTTLVNKFELHKRLSDYEERLKMEEGLTNLQKEAQYWLKDIKFQQSFTSGWSGALKLPVGIEGGVNKAVTLAQKQMSNPEIVASFVKFLGSIAREYKVIIGIDELDKIESDEDAQKFLNEIKSIFGIPNCFYLISVSENAMSNFERRGLAFRDAFDSSFDNVVYVDYLDYQSAKRLLERRILGKPLPFIYLSYCLAGGLPRDLIRTFRNLLELNQKTRRDNPQGESITTLCQAIITSEIKGKVRAIIAAAKKIELDVEGDKFVKMVFQLGNNQLNNISLLKSVETLLNWKTKKLSVPTLSEEDKVNLNSCKKIEKLSMELGSYIYFLTTIWEFFNNSLAEIKLKQAANNGDLENLAKARRLIADSPNITVLLLNDFRESWGLIIPPITDEIEI